MQPLEILQKYFGYDSFRPQQEEIIDHILRKKDALVLMPTGGGKSLCYQVPALMLEGLTVVVSPLIALMKDQVDALKVSGVRAAFLNSSLSVEEQHEVLGQIQKRELKLLYLAPERLLGTDKSLVNFLKALRISLVAVDEAHCISHWGHDFRPEYRQLAELRRDLPEVPFIALTATADKLTRQDIIARLELNKPVCFISSFNRINIHYTVEPKRRSFEHLVDFLEQRRDQPGIIYCLSRQSTEDLAGRLKQLGYAAAAYHAGLEKTLREERQEQFLKDEVQIMVATIAFGMGIDKSNVRFVVHMDMPKNIESYYQETGRAGRDGLPSQALLFFTPADVIKLRRFAEVEDNEEQTRIMLQKLYQMSAYCQSRTCRRKYLLNYFGEDAPLNCSSCDICQGKYEHIDGTIIAQKALSAVARLDQRFGTRYVVDFLRGSASARIQERHKQLKTYGVGADISKEDWMAHIDELTGLGYLVKTEGEYPILQLTPRSRAVLQGKEEVRLSVRKGIQPVREEKPEYETVLFNELRTLRQQLAREENVPPYIILSDATLTELATYLPRNIQDMYLIPGFGEVKVQRYGESFRTAVDDYCQAQGLETRIKEKPRNRTSQKTARGSAQQPGRTRTNDTRQASLELYRQGKAIHEIAQMRSLTINTVENHLAHFIKQGALPMTALVSEEKAARIQSVLQQLGKERLAPVKQQLGKNYSYGEIKAVIAHAVKNEA